MKSKRLSSEQTKVAVNAIQLFEILENYREKAIHVEGSMHWKRISGRHYLYHAFSHGKNRSLGPRSSETEAIKEEFQSHKRQYREHDKELARMLSVHAAYVRANGLNRFPATPAYFVRLLQKQGVSVRVAGNYAHFAYEVLTGVLLDKIKTETLEIEAECCTQKVLDILKDFHASPRGARSLVNGLNISVCTETEAKSIQAVVFDQRGFPLRLIVPNPEEWKHEIHNEPDELYI